MAWATHGTTTLSSTRAVTEDDVSCRMGATGRRASATNIQRVSSCCCFCFCRWSPGRAGPGRTAPPGTHHGRLAPPKGTQRGREGEGRGTGGGPRRSPGKWIENTSPSLLPSSIFLVLRGSKLNVFRGVSCSRDSENTQKKRILKNKSQMAMKTKMDPCIFEFGSRKRNKRQERAKCNAMSVQSVEARRHARSLCWSGQRFHATQCSQHSPRRSTL